VQTSTALSTEWPSDRLVPKDSAELIAEHSVRVWRSLKYLGVADQDLGDASQEVFLVVVRRVGEFRGSSSFGTWVYGICLGVARNYRRRVRREAYVRTDAMPEGVQHATQEVDLELQQSRALLRDALARIPPEQREVFVLHEIEELGMRAIAATVACPLFTAYSRLRLAKKNLSRLLSSSGGDL
jgi:RNA polymerase sigma-70 factor (ECF subfamily)